MAPTIHTFLTPSSSSSYVPPFKLYKPQVKQFVSHLGLPRRSRTSLEPSSFSPVRKTEERIYGEESVYPKKGDGFVEEERLGKSCEVYVCNLPRSCDAAYLLDMFRPYGTILSVEVTLLASLRFFLQFQILFCNPCFVIMN